MRLISRNERCLQGRSQPRFNELTFCLSQAGIACQCVSTQPLEKIHGV